MSLSYSKSQSVAHIWAHLSSVSGVWPPLSLETPPLSELQLCSSLDWAPCPLPIIVLGCPCTISLGTPCWNSCFLMPCFPPSWCYLLFWWSTSGTMVLSVLEWQCFRMTQRSLKCWCPGLKPRNKISFNLPGLFFWWERGVFLFLKYHVVVLMWRFSGKIENHYSSSSLMRDSGEENVLKPGMLKVSLFCSPYLDWWLGWVLDSKLEIIFLQ